MAKYYIRFDGSPEKEQEGEFASAEEARNAAIVMLGQYLQQNPRYAYEHHWRVDIRDHARRLTAHVIVATVAAPSPINWESFDVKPDAYQRR